MLQKHVTRVLSEPLSCPTVWAAYKCVLVHFNQYRSNLGVNHSVLDDISTVRRVMTSASSRPIKSSAGQLIVFQSKSRFLIWPMWKKTKSRKTMFPFNRVITVRSLWRTSALLLLTLPRPSSHRNAGENSRLPHATRH